MAKKREKRRPLPVIGGAGLPVLIAYAILIAWGLIAWQVRSSAPLGRVSQEISISTAELPVVVGYRELGQRPGPRSAATRHIAFERRGEDWFLGNRAHSRRLLVSTTRGGRRFVQRWELREGDRLSFNGATVTVSSVSGSRLVLSHREAGRQVTWDGELRPEGEDIHAVCQGALRRTLDSVKWTARDLSESELMLFSFGGGVNCSDRWKLGALEPRAAVVTWREGKFWLAPGTLRHETLLLRAGEETGRGFADLMLPFEGEYGRITSFIAGQTLYDLRTREAGLVMRPVANRDFFLLDEEPPPNPERWEWIGDGKGPWQWIVSRIVFVGVGLLGAAVLIVLIFLYWLRNVSHDYWWLVHGLAALVPSALGIWLTLLLMQRAGNPDQSLIVGMSWAAWFWATFMLVWTGRMRGYAAWLWPLALGLAAIGVVTLFQLGAGAENTRWIGFYDKHAALVGIFGWGIAAISVVRDRFWRDLWLQIFNREIIVAVTAIVLIAAMILQFLVGGEEGIAGIQPVEIVKTVFVILLGYVGLHVTESREREVRAYRTSPLRYLAPYFRLAAIFFLFIASMVVGVRDFSPMVIMGIVFLAWLWKLGGAAGDFSRLAIVWRLVRPALLLVVVGVLAVGAYVYANPDVVPDGFPQKDRIQVWAEPEIHPHSGSQVLGSMDYVGQGGWFGAREWYGLNGPIMTLPAVQDDFVTAFLINRFGAIAGLLMLVLQLAYIATLFLLGNYAQRRMTEGDFRDQNAGIVLGYTIYGLACLHAAHWLISWGNTLGLLPVMGQPMTWLTAGNSHLLGFALLILFISLVTAWVAESYADEKRRSGRLEI